MGASRHGLASGPRRMVRDRWSLLVRDEVEAWTILWFRLWVDDAGRGAIDGWTDVQEGILSVLPQDWVSEAVLAESVGVPPCASRC